MAQDVHDEPFSEAPEPTKMPWMIALLDILGFSSRLAGKGVDHVYAEYRSLVERVIIQEPLMCIGGVRVPGENGRVPAVYSADIRYAYFSDTILLWMPLNPFFPGPFIQRCADLVCEALRIGMPLRGAISLGEGYMHKQTGTFVSDAIVEAARLEAAQNWIGVGFAPSATWDQFVAELSPTQIIEYEVAVKEEKENLRSPLALDWPRRWRETQTTLLTDCLSELTPNDANALYYTNAIAFVHWSEKHHDWHKKSDGQSDFKFLRMRPESEVYPKA
ncbi:MAG: hypothetical protein ACREDV_00980 [Methylocella sp.]